MIKRIKIDGYKCLKGVDIQTSKLNVLVGPNASGKSSMLQPLLLMRQSADKDGKVDALHLSGPLYEGGTIQDVLHPRAEHKISIGLLEAESDSSWLFYHDRNTDNQETKRLIPVKVHAKLPSVVTDHQNGFAYINTERIGPRATYSLPPDDQHLGGLVGMHGEYTAAVLARAFNGYFTSVDGWDKEFAENLAAAASALDNKDLKSDLIVSQGRLDLVCNQILGWIIPGARFEAKEYEQTDLAELRYVRDPLKTKTSVRATHIGFGLTYTLPIITAVLSLRQDGLLVIENPEAHLHPFCQSRMGVFLALMASTGRQMFIETHSDHVINGIRLAISRRLIHAENVFFNFFSRLIDGDTAQITPIKPLPNGRLETWPAGFFDQIESDLSKL